MPSKEDNEKYFAGRADANSQRPENIPPSQGGKYTGFGSSSNIRKEENIDPFEDPMAAVSKGWSMFSSFAFQGAKMAISTAETLGKTVNDNVYIFNIGHSTNGCCRKRSRF
jgi:ADP-ribosylation factor GTPase-activating protein 1